MKKTANTGSTAVELEKELGMSEEELFSFAEYHPEEAERIFLLEERVPQLPQEQGCGNNDRCLYCNLHLFLCCPCYRQV